MSKLLEALKKVQAGERPWPELGICENVRTTLEDELGSTLAESNLHTIEEMFPLWPNYAGDQAYPVEGSGALFGSVSSKRNRWNPEDDHGALRLDLLEWLIQELSK